VRVVYWLEATARAAGARLFVLDSRLLTILLLRTYACPVRNSPAARRIAPVRIAPVFAASLQSEYADKVTAHADMDGHRRHTEHTEPHVYLATLRTPPTSRTAQVASGLRY
jgi:hypothetical protein